MGDFDLAEQAIGRAEATLEGTGQGLSEDHIQLATMRAELARRRGDQAALSMAEEAHAAALRGLEPLSLVRLAAVQVLAQVQIDRGLHGEARALLLHVRSAMIEQRGAAAPALAPLDELLSQLDG